MSWWTAAKALLAGSPKVVDDIFDRENGIAVQAGKFLGGLHFSDQEKSEAHAKLTDKVLAHVEATAGENTVKSKTRRELAVKWISFQLHLVGLTVMCVPLAIFPEGKLMFGMMLKITLSWLMVGGTVTVMAYFFGTYGWGTYIRKGKK